MLRHALNGRVVDAEGQLAVVAVHVGVACTAASCQILDTSLGKRDYNVSLLVSNAV
jgi:hypothetical protein